MPDTASDLTIVTPTPTRGPAERPAGALRPRRLASRLSVRLLLLTIVFGVVTEIGGFAWAELRYRNFLFGRNTLAAHLIFTTLDVLSRETGRVDPLLRDNLMSQGRILGVTVHRPGVPARTFGPAIPAKIQYGYDLRTETVWDEIIEMSKIMLRPDTYAIVVTDQSPSNPSVVVDTIFDLRPIRKSMWDYALKYYLILSLFISTATAALVYISLQWLAVRPLRRLTESMTGFQAAPEDPRSIIRPSGRDDEVGIAELTLAAMQQELRQALLQKERLAGVGTAVAKISHDLKNILATAMLESERLEALPDPEVKRLTAGMVRSVDRAVNLLASTMRFAKEGLPRVNKRPIQLPTMLAEIASSVQAALKKCSIHVGPVPEKVVNVDIDLMHRAFENLLRNAEEAGATRVELSVTQEGGYQTINVTDNGTGLVQNARDNLFVPFAGSARAGGFGLGLPIARELLRVQGGDITLLWTGERGTCFVVRLPL